MCKHEKIKVLQELFDDILKKQLEELNKTAEQHQTGFLWGLQFVKHLIIEKQIELMQSEEK